MPAPPGTVAAAIGATPCDLMYSARAVICWPDGSGHVGVVLCGRSSIEPGSRRIWLPHS
jgi:hypothetical protein